MVCHPSQIIFTGIVLTERKVPHQKLTTRNSYVKFYEIDQIKNPRFSIKFSKRFKYRTIVVDYKFLALGAYLC